MFYIGQEVLCVSPLDLSSLVQGKRYKIVDIQVDGRLVLQGHGIAYMPDRFIGVNS